MQMNKFSFRNSMLSDWENMCGEAFRARWFGTEEERELLDISHVQQVRWGVYFETLIIGSGMGGKTIELTDKERNSTSYKRVTKQAKVARKYLYEQLGGVIKGSQVTVNGVIIVDGIEIPIEGNIDVEYFLNKKTVIIDLKLTGDTSNTFGKYCWGDPDKVDMGQLVMYSELIYQRDGQQYYPETRYYVADNSSTEKVEPLHVEFTEGYRQSYWQRVKNAYVGIIRANQYGYSNVASYNNCTNCPIKLKCSKAVLIPQPTIVIK